MTEEVLFDVNVILDYVLEAGDYTSVEYIISKVSNRQLYGFFPAGLVPLLSHLLEQKLAKTPHPRIKDSKEKLKRVMSHLQLITTIGEDVLAVLDTENYLTIKTAQRVCPDAMVITNSPDSLEQFRTFTPKAFVEYYKDRCKKKSDQILFLNLEREYINLMEEMDQALLSVAAKAQYIMGAEVSQFEVSAAAS